MAAGASKTFGYGMCNPVIRKMAKKSTTFEIKEGKEATYSGIASKTAYFLIMCIVGIVGFFVLHNMFMSNVDMYGGKLVLADLDSLEGVISLETCAVETLVFLAASVIVLFAPFFAWLIRPTIPVIGTLYALCEGYFIGMITEALCFEYKWISLLAFVLTAVIVGGMLFLYVKRIVKVNQKFKTVVSVLFFTMIFGGIIMFLLSFVPILRPVIMGITTFMNNPVISIVGSVIFIIIAALFLLVDFNTIEECVENRMPKKLEWMAAFGLVYTIIYIYFKILNLILKIVSLAQNEK